MRIFWGLVGFWLLAGASIQAQRHQYIVVVDVSASRSQQDLGDERHFLNAIVNDLTFGDEIVAVQMQQAGLTDHPKRWVVKLPERRDNYDSARDREALDGKKRGIRLVLPTFFKAEGGTVQHTDILSTMNIVSEYIRDNGGRAPTIVILSDMLQSARGIEMDKGQRMPSNNFVALQKRQGLIPALPNSCVAVIGADNSNQLGVRVKAFWQGYFTAAGARLSSNDYRFTPPQSLGSICR